MLGNDLTDNINIICPTNHFSSEFFNINKKTLILIKNENIMNLYMLLKIKNQH